MCICVDRYTINNNLRLVQKELFKKDFCVKRVATLFIYMSYIYAAYIYHYNIDETWFDN